MTTDLTEGRELLEAGRASNMWRSKDRDAWRAWLVRNGYALLDLAERAQAAEALCAELEAERNKLIAQRNDYMGSMTILKAAARDLLGRLPGGYVSKCHARTEIKALEELL